MQSSNCQTRREHTWWSVVADGEVRRNAWGIRQPAAGAISRIAANAVCVLPDDLSKVPPHSEVGQVGLAAVGRVVIHLAVIKSLGDKLAHRQWSARVACTDILSVTSSANIAVREGVSYFLQWKKTFWEDIVGFVGGRGEEDSRSVSVNASLCNHPCSLCQAG